MAQVFDLNDAQKDAVLADENILCCACPGSGKTRVLTEKVGYILETTPDALIVLITFSRDAASELKKRIFEKVPANRRDRLVIGTFHSIALKQLKRAKLALRIASTTETLHYVSLAIREVGADITPEIADGLINSCKLDASFGQDHPEALELYEAYSGFMQRDGVMDFADMLFRAVGEIRADNLAPIPATHMLVDEFQDIDRLQLEWLKCHMAGDCIMTAVGDDDQSIYGFRRGLGYKGMMEFAEVAQARVITLNVNYRSVAPVLDYSGRLIARNLDRVQKDFVAFRGTGRQPRVIVCKDKDHQYEDVVNRVLEVCFTNGPSQTDIRANPAPETTEEGGGEPASARRLLYIVKEGQIGILARTNFNLWAMETALIKAGVPCKRLGKKSLWDEHAVEVYCSLLSSIHNHDSVGLDVAFRWAGFPDLVLDDIRKRFGSLLEFVSGQNNAQQAANDYGEAVKEFAKFAAFWVAALPAKDNDDVTGVVDGVKTWMVKTAERRQETTAKGESRDIPVLLSANARLASLYGQVPQRLFKAKMQDGDEKVKKVVLSTFHSSKGLEWEHVFLIDCNQGLVPSKEAEDVHELIEEERRLFYVAMTRARDTLTIYTDKDRVSEFIHDAGFILAEEPALDTPLLAELETLQTLSA